MDILAPFAAAFVLAYVLEPLCARLVAWGIPRALASLLAMALGIVVLGLLVLVAVPLITHEIGALIELAPGVAAEGYALLRPWLLELGVPVEDPDAIRERLLEWLRARAGQVSQALVGTLQAGLGAAFAVVGWAVLVPVAMFFLLKDWDSLFDSVLGMFGPKTREAMAETGREIHQTLRGYLSGQALVLGALAIYFSVALMLADFSNWLALGVLSGLMAAIPYIGFVLSLVLAFIAGALEHGMAHAAIAVAIIYGIGQFLEGFVLTPKLVGDRIGLHPLAVIAALLIFGSLFGIVGVVLALPLSAVILILGRRLLRALQGPPPQ